MAKIYGLNGKIKGRQGNNVFRIRRGTQVVAEYNPSPLNPKTMAQVTQRGKFALANKVAGTLKQSLMFLNTGSATMCNEFVRRNLQFIERSTDSFQMTPLTSVRVTSGNDVLSDVEASIVSGSPKKVNGRAAGFDYNRAGVYVFLYRPTDAGGNWRPTMTADCPMQFISMSVGVINNEEGQFAVTCNEMTVGDLVIVWVAEYSTQYLTSLGVYGSPDSDTALLGVVQNVNPGQITRVSLNANVGVRAA